MDREDTKKILKVIKTEWPHSFSNMSREEMQDMLVLWSEMFQDDDPCLVGTAVKAIVVGGNRAFAPNIGAIKEEMRKLLPSDPDSLPTGEAWALVSKAAANGAYGAEEEFSRLPPLIRKAVGSPGQLKAWAAMDSETFHSDAASLFRRNYDAMRQSAEEAAKLPADIRQMIGAFADSHTLLNG